MYELKIIREALEAQMGALDTIFHGSPMTATRIINNAALATLSRLEIREAETPKDALIIAGCAMTLGLHWPDGGEDWDKLRSSVAAEIERYVRARIASVPKTVNLNDIAELIANMGDGYTNDELRDYFTERGYTITEE